MERRDATASAISDSPNPADELLNKPTIHGPAKPPRFPTEFIMAMPVACDSRLSELFASAQNGPADPQMPKAARQRPANSIQGIVLRRETSKPRQVHEEANAK